MGVESVSQPENHLAIPRSGRNALGEAAKVLSRRRLPICRFSVISRGWRGGRRRPGVGTFSSAAQAPQFKPRGDKDERSVACLAVF